MSEGRGRRAVVATMFVIGAAAVGVGFGARPVGAGVAPPPDGDGDGIRCEVEDGKGENGDTIIIPTQNGRARECAQLEVTKVVTGTPAPSPQPGTTFEVVVGCVPTEENGDMVPRDGVAAQQLPQGQTPPFTTTLTFPEGGGKQSVFIDRPSECTVSETPPPGCTLTSIDPGTTEIEQPILYPVTVSNNCDPSVEPAVAIVDVPRFTG
jgi:Domain of unknown function (DUF5979)